MTRDEFYQEVRDSAFYGRRFEKIYHRYGTYQDKAIEALMEFHRVCEMHDIHYQLAYGSLLGAIRDSGQIPWDGDIDVYVPYTEKRKLIEALNADLSKGFCFKSADTEKAYRHFKLMVGLDGYNIDHLHVDVFFLVDVSGDVGDQEWLREKMRELIRLRKKKLTGQLDIPWNVLLPHIRILINKNRLKNVSVASIDKEMDQACCRFEGSDFCMPLIDENRKLVFEKKFIWDTQLINLNGGVLRICRNYEDVLNQKYSDYKKIYPLENRIHELKRNYYLTRYNFILRTLKKRLKGLYYL